MENIYIKNIERNFIMDKCKLGKFVIDFVQEFILEDGIEIDYKKRDHLGGNAPTKLLKVLIENANQDVRFIDVYGIVHNVPHDYYSESNRSEMVKQINAWKNLLGEEYFLPVYGISEKGVKMIVGYKFVGNIENLDIEADKQTYYQNLCNELKFKLRDGRLDERKLWEFYVNPKIKYYPEEENIIESPFSSQDHPFRYFVIGPSGRGKSTLLEGMCYLCINKFLETNGEDSEKLRNIKKSIFGTNLRNYVPVYIKAKDVEQGRSTRYIENEAKEEIKETLLDFAVAWKENLEGICKTAHTEKDLLICVDAIDEIKKENRDFFFDLFDKFLRIYRDVNIVVTSRYSSEKINEYNFCSYKLCCFDKNDVINIIDLFNKYNSIKPDVIDFTKERLNDVDFLDFISNPYCITVALLREDTAEFAAFLKEMSENIIKFRVSQPNRVVSNIKYLKELAWKMVKNNKTEGIDYQEFSKIMNEMTIIEPGTGKIKPVFNRSEEIDEKIEELSQISGILDQKVDNKNPCYFFQSKLLMSCYAARYVIDFIENKGNDLTYDDVKNLINIETEEGVNTLILAISLSGSNDSNAGSARILFDYLISAVIHSETNISETLIIGLKRLHNKYFGHTIFHNPARGKESIHQKIIADILELNEEK